MTRKHISSSPRAVMKVNEALQEENTRLRDRKIEKIKIAGFHGLLELSMHTMHAKAVEFLCDRFDKEIGMFRLDHMSEPLPITEEDVCRVYSLPMGNRPIVLHGNLARRGEKTLQEEFGFQSKSVHVAEIREMIKECTSGKKFAKLYILYALGVLLAPSSNNTVSLRYGHALEPFSEIQEYNWARHVRDILVEKLTVYSNATAKTKPLGDLHLMMIHCLDHTVCDGKESMAPTCSRGGEVEIPKKWLGIDEADEGKEEEPETQALYLPIVWPSDNRLYLGWIQDFMSKLDWASRYLAPAQLPTMLSVQVFDKLVEVGSEILHEEPNCVRIDGDSKVVVVGDVHGQLHDVLFLLKNVGFLGGSQIMVFNGDYVDRGAWGLETFLLLLACKVYMPERVYLLRGNHESEYCTSVYGFQNEVMTKYGERGEHVYRECLTCFKELPLASIIGGQVFTAHGGLFRSCQVAPTKRKRGKKTKKGHQKLSLGSIDELSQAKRHVLEPCFDEADIILADVLWSDPAMTLGLSSNDERGVGLLWGPDCTEEFLKKHHLKLIIRSHEGPDAREKREGLARMIHGYTIDHVVDSGQLITLFSAPDYPQFQAAEKRFNNKGAYIVLEPPNFDKLELHSFGAVLPRPEANPYYDFENVADSDEELDLSPADPAS